MTASDEYNDPRQTLTHASLYLWRQWREYDLEALQDSLNILRRARTDVDEEDEALFVKNLDAFLNASGAGPALSDCALAA
jgi:hypothetical protein